MTYRRIVLQRCGPAVEHHRAPRRRRLSLSHSPNRTITTSRASCTNPRGSIYQTEPPRYPQTAPLLGERYDSGDSSKTCQVKRQQFQFQQISSNWRSPKSLKSHKVFTDLPHLRNLQVFDNLPFLPSTYPDI